MKHKLIMLDLVGESYSSSCAYPGYVICKKGLERIVGRALPDRMAVEYSLESFPGSVGVEIEAMFIPLSDGISYSYILPGGGLLYIYATKLIHDLVLETYGKPFDTERSFTIYLKCSSLEIVYNPKCL